MGGFGMNEPLTTKYGTAKINKDGYYWIVSSKEGNNGKRLHRLIYEDFWDVKLPKEIVIHHKDGNKLNNCILNLESMTHSEHSKLHHKGKEFSEQYKQKLSENHADVSKENNSRWKNYARIIKAAFSNGKQRYSLRFEGKTIKYSVYPEKLIGWFLKEYPLEIIQTTIPGGI